jgi:hypothetical protein
MSGKTMVPETAQSLVVPRVAVRGFPVSFLVTVGLADSGGADTKRLFWFADVQSSIYGIEEHPEARYGSELPLAVEVASRALLAGGVLLTHEGEDVNLIPPQDPRTRTIGVPVLRQLMVRDTSVDLRYMPSAEGQGPLVIPHAPQELSPDVTR